MELTQPNINMLPSNDPRAWELTPVIYCQWAKEVLPQVGYDTREVNMFVLGHAINMILYDDWAVFSLLYFPEDYQSEAGNVQRQIQTRIDWEASLELFPRDIQCMLLAIQGKLQDGDWNDLEQIREAYVSWQELKDSVQERIEEGGDLKNVFCLYQDINNSITPYWQEFLSIKRLRQ